MNPKYISEKKSHILYDADIVDQVNDDFFVPEHWRRQDQLTGSAPGRGTAVFVRHGDRELVLRHYHRGGLAAKLARDHYVWFGLDRTRAWREWHLLRSLADAGLPVPRPVAARVIRDGWAYSADIVTLRLKGRPLSELAGLGPLDRSLWLDVGKCIRRFHDARVYHADLNAHNILIDENGTVYLIDFDRGEFRQPGRWRQRNLSRLHRSLSKLAAQRPGFVFGEREWSVLREGYG